MRYAWFTSLAFAVALLTLAVSDLACAVDYYTSGPAVGRSVPNDPYHTATKGEITQFGNVHQEDFPAVFLVPFNCEVCLTGTRASTDWDIHWTGSSPCNVIQTPVEDSLRPNWPRWKCAIGSFLDGDGPEYGDGADHDLGLTVTWKAPNSPGLLPGKILSLWDDDDRKVEDPVDPRNDEGFYGYGHSQDEVMVRAVELDVTLFIRNEEYQETASNSQNGPDSHGELGLWDAKVGEKNDMRICCNNHEAGDVDNGGASYLNLHPWAVGTGLKTEMYAKIVENDFIDYDFMMELLDNPDNWRRGQESNGHLKLNGTDTDTDHLPPEWDPDGPPSDPDNPYRNPDDKDTIMDCDPERTTEYFYHEDCPRIDRYDSELAQKFDEGDVVSVDRNFRTWMEFCYLGSWVRVTDVPAPEGEWTEGKPMWGYTGELTMGPSAFSVTQQATAKSY